MKKSTNLNDTRQLSNIIDGEDKILVCLTYGCTLLGQKILQRTMYSTNVGNVDKNNCR